MIFNNSKFIAGISILDTRYKYFKSKNNNLIYSFNSQIDYILVYYFINFEIPKCNINKFLINFLIKLITKNLLYQNANKLIEKLFIIL